ncbi:hypothetical protein HIM_05648 [Hirsutella minnesotensis 3608]|uniref:DUF7704 domain-containing protein n=1 Tax=Hirsutella minnesotensis 3608 TaxID=1043627 RepID=A0A0F7ZZZ5_9HYPO|nr:hypothetical protein HIM_05648 [Hirsutella minnesotensis 3608]
MADLVFLESGRRQARNNVVPRPSPSLSSAVELKELNRYRFPNRPQRLHLDLQADTMAPQAVGFRLPVVYRAFFLLIEPISAAVGAYYSHFRQQEYLELLHAASAPSNVSTTTSVALSQLANMYLFFALNEALVLRSTWDLRVWRTVLTVLLIADIGHLYSMKGLGSAVFYDVTSWNISHCANILWVYAGATLRLCFIAGIGLRDSKRMQKQQ